MVESLRKGDALVSIIQDLTNLDILLLGKEGQILEELGRQNIPDEFFFTVEEVDLLKKRLSYGETVRFANAVTGAGFNYVVVEYSRGTRKEDLLFIGPFLVMPVPGDIVSRAILRYHLPVGDIASVRNLYDSVPHVGKGYAANLCFVVRALLQDCPQPLETIEFQSESMEKITRRPTELSMMDQNRVKDFYLMEKALRNAVEAGNYGIFHAVSKEGNYFNYFKFRVTQDTLRAAKNMNIGYNAMLRLAALDGGANPILVHSLTWRYVRIAQAAHSVEELMKIQNAMADDFIALVRNRKFEAFGSKLREALEYVDLHLNGDLTLKALADYTRMSPPNLAYYFRKELGTTFQEYLNGKRIEAACLLLNDTALSIKEIAAMAGFCNESHFVKVFREKEGLTPKRFRSRRSLERP